MKPWPACLALAGFLFTVPPVSARGTRSQDKEVGLLLSRLTGFRAHKLDGADPDFSTYAPSPDGRWTASIHEGPPPGEPGEGTYPSYVRLWDRNGKFVKDLTEGMFYRATDFGWSQTGRALYVLIDPAFENNPGGESIWKVQLGVTRPFRPQLPWMPRTSEEGLPVMSPSGNSYLVYDSLSRSVWRIWTRSGKRRRLARGYAPRWSPDGRWILFHSGPEPSAFNDIRIMKADGSGRRRVLGAPEVASERARRGWPTPFGTMGLVPVGFVAHRPLVLLQWGYSSSNGESHGGLWLVDYARLRREFLPATHTHLAGMSRDGEHLYVRRSEMIPGSSPAHYRQILYRLDYGPNVRHRRRAGA